MGWLSRLSCVFGHDNEGRYRERRAGGRVWLVCPRCGHSVPMIAGTVGRPRRARRAGESPRRRGRSRKACAPESAPVELPLLDAVVAGEVRERVGADGWSPAGAGLL
jgi:hypothetical protein